MTQKFLADLKAERAKTASVSLTEVSVKLNDAYAKDGSYSDEERAAYPKRTKCDTVKRRANWKS